jgi:hypothetical protein
VRNVILRVTCDVAALNHVDECAGLEQLHRRRRP